MDPSTPEPVAAFLRLLDEAARRVPERWFLLPVAVHNTTGPVTRYRERVYCYELYHQIRVLSEGPWGAAAGAPAYVLSGEIDKAGLNAVIDGGQHKPDLVWHKPGDWRHNAVVVEVKAAAPLRPAPLRKDIDTLSVFLQAERGYECGALLIYGETERDALRGRVLRAADRVGLSDAVRRRTQLLWHSKAGDRIKNLGTLTR